MQEKMSSNAESLPYRQAADAGLSLRAWVRVGVIAAASALAAGLAAAWYNRKTLNHLREAESAGSKSESPIPESEMEYDI